MGQWISVQAPLQFQPGQRMPYFVTHSMTSEGLAYTDQKEESVTVDPNSFKLDTAELNKSPEDVFDIISKVGEGSYGSVHKAIHRGTGHTLAIKKVPVDTDLQEIIKEITIMQQCDNVVKYYGSYFKNSDLWIVMEYCGAGIYFPLDTLVNLLIYLRFRF
ncbi:protein kinase domain-containing protein [Ditylenchus destructor]|uniref:Protein kinase domain-containing protein n=1 Tax=Ditylenchus destructor TaxID=166010 RepID=A0AAD4N8K4_9BILA|nr:protein kinase domain-containing protein [Ditylenchus destructor]